MRDLWYDKEEIERIADNEIDFLIENYCRRATHKKKVRTNELNTFWANVYLFAMTMGMTIFLLCFWIFSDIC